MEELRRFSEALFESGGALEPSNFVVRREETGAGRRRRNDGVRVPRCDGKGLTSQLTSAHLAQEPTQPGTLLAQLALRGCSTPPFPKHSFAKGAGSSLRCKCGACSARTPEEHPPATHM